MERTSPANLTYVITGLQYGGANIGMVRLLSGLCPKEFDIQVISITETSEDVVHLIPDHVDVHRLHMTDFTDLIRVPQLFTLLQETDILICSLFHASILAVPLGLLQRIPTVLVWQHNTKPANKLRSMGYRVIYNLSDRTLADSERVKTFLQSQYGVNKEKISVLPIAGIDPEVYTPEHTEPQSGEISIGTVGRLTPEKGYDTLQECARKFNNDYQFYIAGEGAERERLEKYCPSNVTLCGSIPSEKIPEFLNQHDIYFQPSRREGLCMTVIEAMSCGLPVVGSSVGGIPESVKPGTTGYLCPPGDVECFSRKLRTLGQDPALRRKMGKSGRERVIEEYSQQALVEQFHEVLAEIR